LPTFADRLIRWQLAAGRHHLPWQGNQDPYAIWVAEIMLQQTQVVTVIPYYQQFMRAFPDIATLAHAAPDDVLALWSGLGYYARGRNLHQAARLLISKYGGVFPASASVIEQLPGIGRSTAAAIAAFAFGERCAILDGNVKRILVRYFGIRGHPAVKTVEARLWQLAEKLLPIDDSKKSMAIYTQAFMDLGALVCTRRRPKCECCPLQSECIAFAHRLTDQLPISRPQKTHPKKSVIHLLLVKDGEILLRKRPSTGIWGGLWCFPEIPFEPGNSYSDSASLLNYNAPSFELPCIIHTFTHFKLKIYPQLIHIGHDSAFEEKDNECWVTVKSAIKLAIPAPIKKVLLMVSDILESPVNMVDIDKKMKKKQLRQDLRQLRGQIMPAQRLHWSHAISDNLKQGFPQLQSSCVGSYWPHAGEYDPLALMQWLNKQGATLALPKVLASSEPLEFVAWWPGVPMKNDAYGIPVPDNSQAVIVDVVLIPMLGFDAGGFRLGYGSGYFDRTLGSLDPRPLTIGIAFEVLRVPTIFPQLHDIAMDYVVTEQAIYYRQQDKLVTLSAEECTNMTRHIS
jgi:A/G-specific adenine glycosylase